LNILFVADVSIHKVIGGAERVLFEQSTRLAQRGHNVHILTRGLRGHKTHEELIQGVWEWRYDVDQGNPLLFIKSTYLNGNRLFERLHSEYRFDCINLHQPFSGLGVIRSPLGKRIKKVYTCHSLSFEEFKTRTPKPEGLIGRSVYSLNSRGRKYVEKKVMNNCDWVVVLSEFTMNRLYRFYRISEEKKIEIIPGGVDLERFYPAHDKVKIRKGLNLPGEKTILLTVRNLVPRMGLENLIIAIKEVVKVASDIYLVLGGEGPLKKDLIDLTRQLGVEDFIRFEGFIPEEELPAYYRMADVFVLPTLELEGFGLVTLEALASGVPVLGTPIGGTVEILRRLNPGLLFKDVSSESIAELILDTHREFQKNPVSQGRLSIQCRRFVEQNYSWKKNVDRLEDLFREILES
jgi:glycosyltransferase involved in cell wall biosynthesis